MENELTLNWFKSQINRVFKKEKPEIISDVKPYKNIKLVNDVLTIILHDGSIISKSNCDAYDFQSAKLCYNEQGLLNLLSCPELVEEHKKQEIIIEKNRSIIDGFDILKDLNEFTIVNDSVYLSGIDRSIPQLMMEEVLDIINKVKNKKGFDNLNKALKKDKNYQALKRFFMWCCLNPRAEVADELYGFLKKNAFKITKQGFIVALRNVVTVNQSEDNELVKFISNHYNKIKAVWRKNPNLYRVVKNDRNELFTELCTSMTSKGELIGNLTTLYMDLPNMKENRFTDDWTKTFDIRIGKVVEMPLQDCNWTTQDCAASGLHFTSDQINYVGCGDTSVLVLINPMKIVGIGQHKGRCYEYLPIMTVPREEATEILHDLDFDTLELDEDYAIKELQNLKERVKEGFSIEASKHKFNLPNMSTSQIKIITKSLSKMTEEISKRVLPTF